MIGEELKIAIQNEDWNAEVFDRLNKLEKQSKALTGIQHNFMPGYKKLEHVMSGTAFPSAVSTNQKYFRTDLGLLCYYDGTRWLTQEFHLSGRHALSADNVGVYRIPNGGYSVYLPNKNVTSSTRVATTNDGSNYWTVLISLYDSTLGNATTIHTFTTAADTANTWTEHDDTPDSQTPSHADMLRLSLAKTSSPGSINVGFGVAYQLIIT